MVSRSARVVTLALATTLLFFYHSHLLALSGYTSTSTSTSDDDDAHQIQTTTVIQWPLSQDPPPPTPEHLPAPAFPGIPQDNHSPDGTPSAFNEIKFPFQDDLLAYRPPRMPLSTLTQYAPHNAAASPGASPGAGQAVFATYLSTRNNSIHDPYFLAAQQLVYRLLWAPQSRSTAPHPVVVFVAPFIPSEQRDILRAQGAIVRELELVPWNPPPTEDGEGEVFPFARWRDLFSKLNIWAQTDFARVAFLDLDAFPLAPLDALLTDAVAPRGRCRVEALSAPEDKLHSTQMCDYVWAGHSSGGGEGDGEMNVGVVVLEPNKYMHARLLRESADTTGAKWDSRMAEQAFLNYAFGEAGPFPPTARLGREWNGYFPVEADQGRLRVVHEKLWMLGDRVAWTRDIFREGWEEILRLYESEVFVEMRRADGLVGTGGAW